MPECSRCVFGKEVFRIIFIVCGFLVLGGCGASVSEVKFTSGAYKLGGFIHKPEGEGPFPAVLYNHGSERLPGSKDEVGATFTSKGYVLFVPHRRGQGRSRGDYIMEHLRQYRGEERRRLLVELMEQHLKDQIAALNYLKSLPYVSSDKVAIAGCSFGGIQTMLAAERDLGVKAAVNFAGAAQTWRQNELLQKRLLEAAKNAKVPVMLLQAANDFDVTPSRELAAAMKAANKPHELIIFPAFGTTNRDGHAGFCFRGGNVWGQAVSSFLAKNM